MLQRLFHVQYESSSELKITFLPPYIRAHPVSSMDPDIKGCVISFSNGGWLVVFVVIADKLFSVCVKGRGSPSHLGPMDILNTYANKLN